MKFILLNINDTSKNIVNQIQLDSKNYIKEVSLSKKILENLNTEPTKLIQKLKYRFYGKDIEKKIIKALEGYNKKWYYVLSNNILNTKYLTSKLESLLGHKLATINELNNNINKYVQEYLESNKVLKKHELKVLLVSGTNKNLNFTLVETLIKEYKTVNVYLKEKPSSYIIQRIKQINKSEGSSIEILKKDKKSLSEYNVIYFVDENRESFPRLRLNKNALILDLDLSQNDKFNTNIIFINEFIQNKDVCIDNISNLLNQYNKMLLAVALNKIVN